MKKRLLSVVLGISILTFGGVAHANTEPVIEPGSGSGDDYEVCEWYWNCVGTVCMPRIRCS